MAYFQGAQHCLRVRSPWLWPSPGSGPLLALALSCLCSCASPASFRAQNEETRYKVWADLAVKNGMAIRNPLFDPEKPYDEVIIWTPEGLDRLLSMDETDVRTDQSKRAKSPGARSVIVN